MECPHREVKLWSDNQKLLGSGPLLSQAVTVNFGGWKCVECGERFYPKSWVDKKIEEAKNEKR